MYRMLVQYDTTYYDVGFDIIIVLTGMANFAKRCF